MIDADAYAFLRLNRGCLGRAAQAIDDAVDRARHGQQAPRHRAVGLRPMVGERRVVRSPAVAKQSFSVNGTPCKGPQEWPRASASSASLARRSARSASSVTMALSA